MAEREREKEKEKSERIFFFCILKFSENKKAFKECSAKLMITERVRIKRKDVQLRSYLSSSFTNGFFRSQLLCIS